MATSKTPLSTSLVIPTKPGDPITGIATTASKVSPEQLEQFVNFLPEGQRSPMDFAKEMDKRGYWGASDMYKGAQDTAAQFAKDGRQSTNPAKDYTDNRKYSQLWHTELLQNVLANAKKIGVKNSAEFLANKDYLLNHSKFGNDNFNTIMNQPAQGGETRGQNFWRVASTLYDDLQKKEKTSTPPSSLLVKK